MSFQIDGFLYPDTDIPVELATLADRVDFLVRLCAAWDFGILPDHEAEACQLLTSPSYHLLRQWHKLTPPPYLGQQLAYIRNDPNLAYI